MVDRFENICKGGGFHDGFEAYPLIQAGTVDRVGTATFAGIVSVPVHFLFPFYTTRWSVTCLLYTSDAADE